jgi:hypothetical protein
LKTGNGGNFDAFDQLLGNSDQEINKLKTLLNKNKGKYRGAGGKEAFPEDFVFR